MVRFQMQCYGVAANDNRIVNIDNSGIMPNGRHDFCFCNIGKTAVYCEAVYGTEFGWIGAINGIELDPGESGKVGTTNNLFYVTGQKIYNRGNVRAYVHGSTTIGYDKYECGDEIPLKIDINKVSKTLVAFGVGYIPVVGEVLSELVNFFWPDTEVSAWDQIKDQLNDVVDSKIKEAIQGLLGGDIRSVKEKITVLKLELEDPKSKEINQKYMNIAEELIGFEKKFSFSKEDNSDYININFYLLPMYSAVINLKLLFYQYGIINQSKLQISDDNVYDLKQYSKRLIDEENDGAIAYITTVFNEQFQLEYDQAYPDRIFDMLAVVRHHCAINGFEFFEYWKAIVNDPFIKKKPYCQAISYSTMSYRPTPTISRQMVPDEVPVPLQPKLVDGKRIKIKHILVFVGNGSKIHGIDIHYQNDDYFIFGDSNGEQYYVPWDDYLKSIKVWGNESLDQIEFELYNGKKYTFGSNNSGGRYRVFELDKHYICGFFVDSEGGEGNMQVLNMAVSYQLLPDEDYN